jgi:hypothetical protein
LLRHSTYKFLGCLPLEVVFILRICTVWFGYLSLSFKFEYDPIIGSWDISLLIFWGRLPLEVIFIFRICRIWHGHLSISLKFEFVPISGCWDIQLSNFKVGGSCCTGYKLGCTGYMHQVAQAIRYVAQAICTRLHRL